MPSKKKEIDSQDYPDVISGAVMVSYKCPRTTRITRTHPDCITHHRWSEMIYRVTCKSCAREHLISIED